MWKMRHFRHFTSEQNKVSKSNTVEKVTRVADCGMSADDMFRKLETSVDVCWPVKLGTF